MGWDVPNDVRVEFAHAHVQWIADDINVRLLHIKGPALDPSLRWPGRFGSDADILVSADQAAPLVGVMQSRGWIMACTFANSSAFEHAATLRHDDYGWADIHRFFPGLSADPDATFDRLWRDGHLVSLGGRPCTVPSIAAQSLILLLHAGRSPGGRAAQDIAVTWGQATADRRADIERLVDELSAHVGFAAAVGGLDAYRDRPDYDLWRVARRGGTRMTEWRARIKAAPSVRKALRVALRAPLVNVEHLQMMLWRPPTRGEIVKEFFARPVRGAREELRAWRSRRASGTRR